MGIESKVDKIYNYKMKRRAALNKNILLYRLILFSGGNGLTTSVIFFFLTQVKGLSVTETLSLVGFALLAVAITEVPTGVIADKVSRKFSIVLGLTILLFSWFGILVSTNYWLILIFTLGRGVGGSFISGADEALLYDSLRELKQSDKFKSIYNHSQSIELMSFALTILIGGLLADVNLLLPIVIHLIFLAISIIFACLLTEPTVTKEGQIYEQTGYITHIRTSLKRIFSRNGLFSGLLGAFVSIALVLSVFKSTKNILSPILDEFGFSISEVGLIISAVILIKAAGAFIAGKINKKGNEVNETIAGLLICSIGLLAIIFIHLPPLQLFIFIVIVSLDNIILTNLKTIINEGIQSKYRSTILSISSLMARGSEMAFLTSFGWIIDSQSLNIALMFTTVWLSSAIFVLFTLKFFKRLH